MPQQTSRYWALIPAAGVGSRVAAGMPKQYLAIDGRTMLEHSVAAMLAVPWIHRVLVVCSPDDDRASALLSNQPRVSTAACGGPTRRDSVLGGLRWLAREGQASVEDWVLVHDAARPGLQPAELERLRAALDSTAREQGVDCALLALRVADTVKQSQADRAEVERTIDRSRLWLAQTPQASRLGGLLEALEACPHATDEASAIEAAGGQVRLIEGSGNNFKVTTSDDLERMRWLMERRK
jgi:2-C-methyl-D-erythritol 4-phosphate cytidylyltransferase